MRNSSLGEFIHQKARQKRPRTKKRAAPKGRSNCAQVAAANIHQRSHLPVFWAVGQPTVSFRSRSTSSLEPQPAFRKRSKASTRARSFVAPIPDSSSFTAYPRFSAPLAVAATHAPAITPARCNLLAPLSPKIFLLHLSGNFARFVIIGTNYIGKANAIAANRPSDLLANPCLEAWRPAKRRAHFGRQGDSGALEQQPGAKKPPQPGPKGGKPARKSFAL